MQNLNINIDLKDFNVANPEFSQMVGAVKTLDDLVMLFTTIQDNVGTIHAKIGQEPEREMDNAPQVDQSNIENNIKKPPPKKQNQKKPPAKPQILSYADASYWNDDTKFSWSDSVKNTNLQVFGNSTFRTNQKAIINCVLSKKDVFVLMPTGGGKSLIYQLTSVLCPGLTIAIMPLIALINDQSRILHTYGIKHIVFNGNSSKSAKKRFCEDIKAEYFATGSNARKQKTKCILTTPEQLMKNGELTSLLNELNSINALERFVIDECHCIVQWGFDFRKEYKELGSIRGQFPEVPMLCQTATATEEMRMEIAFNQNFKEGFIFQSRFNRSNLMLEVRLKNKIMAKNKKEGKMATIAFDIAKFLHQYSLGNKCGIVYACTTKDCEQLAEHLAAATDREVLAYHGKLPDETRVRNYQKWMRGDINILVGTIAFGMGIDKGDVRFVVHFCTAKSLEHYYQEMGRAGRDGNKAYCLLYYENQDRSKMEKFQSGNVAEVHKVNLLKNLGKMTLYCENTFECRRKMIIENLGEQFDEADCKNTCDNCIRKQFIVQSQCKNININQIDITQYNTILQDQGKLVVNDLSDLACNFVDSWIQSLAVPEMTMRQQTDALLNKNCTNKTLNNKIKATMIHGVQKDQTELIANFIILKCIEIGQFSYKSKQFKGMGGNAYTVQLLRKTAAKKFIINRHEYKNVFIYRNFQPKILNDKKAVMPDFSHKEQIVIPNENSNQSLSNVFQIKLRTIEEIQEDFSDFLQLRRKAIFKKELAKKENAYGSQQINKSFEMDERFSSYDTFIPFAALNKMMELIPKTPEELIAKIKAFPEDCRQYAKDFVLEIKNFLEKLKPEEKTMWEQHVNKQISDTHEEFFDIHRMNKKVQELYLGTEEGENYMDNNTTTKVSTFNYLEHESDSISGKVAQNGSEQMANYNNEQDSDNVSVGSNDSNWLQNFNQRFNQQFVNSDSNPNTLPFVSEVDNGLEFSQPGMNPEKISNFFQDEKNITLEPIIEKQNDKISSGKKVGLDVSSVNEFSNKNNKYENPFQKEKLEKRPYPEFFQDQKEQFEKSFQNNQNDNGFDDLDNGDYNNKRKKNSKFKFQ